MNERDLLLLRRILIAFNGQYDDAARLVRSEGGSHSVRSSANYALGLLMAASGRAGAACASVCGLEAPDAVRRADAIVHAVIDCQLTEPGQPWTGTYRRRPDEPTPRAGAVVWDDFDPNWREFIATVFAVILEEYGDRLPAPTTARMLESAHLAAVGSAARRAADEIPMNTNIELMHLFITDHYGRTAEDPLLLEASRDSLAAFMALFRRTGTVSEFNSSTYCGVDFIALSCIRTYGFDAGLKEAAAEVEERLWDCIADFYEPAFGNLCGPFSRGYEMDMALHSSMGAILYRSFGDAFLKLAPMNCESFTDPLLTLSDVRVPARLETAFCGPRPPRLVRHSFTELCERHPKGGRHFPCTATAWLTDRLMMGALAGSRNTSGQLHPGTIFWLHEGRMNWIRLSRRRPGGHWSEHFTGIEFDGRVEEDRFDMQIRLSGEDPIEVFLEMHGEGISDSRFDGPRWELPGLSFDAAVEWPAPPAVRRTGGRLELYSVYSGGDPALMRFRLTGFRTAGSQERP